VIIKKNLKVQGLKNLKSILNGIFNYALDCEYIQSNPMFNLKISTANISTDNVKEKEAVVFTLTERNLIRQVIEDNKENYKECTEYAILFSFQLGLRVSELVALKWSDISCNGNSIHIQRQEIIYNVYNDDFKKEKNLYTKL